MTYCDTAMKYKGIVIGIDCGLRHTGLYAIVNGKATWRNTISVEGDKDDTGPRFTVLRIALEKLLAPMKIRPEIVAIEQPELGIRKGHAPGAILKLYAAFAITYAEVSRIWPHADIHGVEPRAWKGNLKKSLTSQWMASKYGIKRFPNSHEADALGLADWAWDLWILQKRSDLTQRN